MTLVEVYQRNIHPKFEAYQCTGLREVEKVSDNNYGDGHIVIARVTHSLIVTKKCIDNHSATLHFYSLSVRKLVSP